VHAREARGGVVASREHLAKAIAGDVLDPAELEQASARVDASASGLKDAMRGALERIHAVLDPKQRERLAEILTRGWRGMGGGDWRHRHAWGGPYRG
jgi:hypothetical protein